MLRLLEWGLLLSLASLRSLAMLLYLAIVTVYPEQDSWEEIRQEKCRQAAETSVSWEGVTWGPSWQTLQLRLQFPNLDLL